jgi:hypothetical protein
VSNDYKKIKDFNMEALSILTALRNKKALVSFSLENQEIKEYFDSNIILLDSLIEKNESFIVDYKPDFDVSNNVVVLGHLISSILKKIEEETDLTKVELNPYLSNEIIKKQIELINKSIGEDKSALQAIVQLTNEINDNKGSVQTLDFLTDEEKSVFKTFREINQMELVKQASERQPYIEQGQSLNLAFFYDAPAKWIYDVHYEAWKAGLKGLYYLRSQSALSNSNISNLYTNCISCEG